MFLGAEVAKLFRQDGGRSERTKHLKVTLAHYWQTIGWPFEKKVNGRSLKADTLQKRQSLKNQKEGGSFKNTNSSGSPN